MFVHGIISLVLLAALAKIDTSYSLDRDAQVISPSSDREPRAGTELYPGETLQTGSYALTLLATFACARLTLRSDMQVRADTRRYYPAAEADQIHIPLSLLKGTLRSVTGYIGGAARTGYSVFPTSIMLLGIRG